MRSRELEVETRDRLIQVGSEILELSSSLSDRFDVFASRILDQRAGQETNAVDARKMAFKAIAPSNDVVKPPEKRRERVSRRRPPRVSACR
jgi:hypothetical protein